MHQMQYVMHQMLKFIVKPQSSLSYHPWVLTLLRAGAGQHKVHCLLSPPLLPTLRRSCPLSLHLEVLDQCCTSASEHDRGHVFFSGGQPLIAAHEAASFDATQEVNLQFSSWS